MDAARVKALAERMRRPIKGLSGQRGKPPTKQARVLIALAAGNPLGVVELSDAIMVRRTEVYAALNQLLDRGLVIALEGKLFGLSAGGKEFVEA